MPTYKGNRGNLLQHWVLAELVTHIGRQTGPTAHLCFVDAHAMSPYATRDEKPGQTASDFETVRDRLPGPGSRFEQAWRRLVTQERIEYPTSAMFVRDLWDGPLSLVLCEADNATADDIFEWQRELPTGSTTELYRGDWRRRIRGDLPEAQACIVSFDPYMVVGDNPASTRQGNMYVSDLVRAAGGILEIRSGPLFVQLSTYSAQDSPQDKLIPVVQWVMAAVGLELVDTVRADGHMMSMVFSHGIVEKPAHLHDRFNAWLTLATGPA